MITMYKLGRTKEVAESDVQGQLKNGWTVGEQPVKAVLRPVKNTAAKQPAVEEESLEDASEEDVDINEQGEKL